MKITKNKYLAGFSAIVVLLALVRCIFPDIAKDRQSGDIAQADSLAVDGSSIQANADEKTISDNENIAIGEPSMFFTKDGKQIKNRIFSVPSFKETFPDNNDVQLVAAQKYGVKPVENRHDAEMRKKELVYVSASPYYHVEKLRSSIPYLVPRAANLLNDIGRTFFDSLQIKGVPLHKIIITSVLRSREDIKKLRGHNSNATENSCHLYGTTFDISYNRYKTVEDPDGPSRRPVRNDTLKWVLSEVLRDMRENNRCYIKYEVKQGCFHITVR
ncbi:MAG: DUF5715 family protein [Prevotellaceae bacterium]|nr:DUF5715 family protein [Prevotellaceae bacterium]